MTMTLENQAPGADTAAKPQTVELTADMLYSIASVTVAAEKSNGQSPIIQTVRLSVTDGIVSALATDRYRVARVTFPALENDSHNQPADWSVEPVTIPRDLVERFAKALKASKPHHTARVTLTVEPGAGEHDPATVTLSETFSGLTMRDSETRGNYPPVERLIPGGVSAPEFGEQGTVSLNISYLADAGKILHPAVSGKAEPAMRFRFTKTSNPEKPGPVLIDRKLAPEQGTLEYLVQPNLLKR